MSRRLPASRRAFLKRAAVSVATPAIVPRHVLASPGRPGANDRAAVGVIGLGIRGSQLLENMPPSARVVALCDVYQQRTDAALARHGANWPVYQDFRRLLERPDLDAVVIATPHHQHVLPAMLACAAGLDVYVEKPLSLYVSEGRALVEAARRYERVVQVGTQQRTMEMNRFACQFVRDGGLGRVTNIEAMSEPGPRPAPRLPGQPAPAGLDWDLWQGQAAARPFHPRLALKETGRGWLNWREYSGAASDIWSHSLDMIQMALGADHTGPVEFWPVAGEGSGPRLRVDWRYASGVKVNLSLTSWARPMRGPRFGAIFTGENGKIEINRNKWAANPPGLLTGGPDPAVAAKWEGEGWIARGHVENWIDCIKTRQRPNADVEIGHRSVTLCHLIDIVRQLGRRITWDPAAEQIIDDPEANALLDRPRRAGWELPPVG